MCLPRSWANTNHLLRLWGIVLAANIFGGIIFAGWLIATLVWVLPSAVTARFMVILFFTWLIALGEFAHIIAGPIEAFHMLFVGELELTPLFLQFMLPTLLGNIVDGSALFSLISCAQVRKEVE